MRRFTTVLIWLANRGSRFYWLWHFGPFKWWLVSVRDPLKHASRR